MPKEYRRVRTLAELNKAVYDLEDHKRYYTDNAVTVTANNVLAHRVSSVDVDFATQIPTTQDVPAVLSSPQGGTTSACNTRTQAIDRTGFTVDLTNLATVKRNLGAICLPQPT
jgi:hypothetical protein